MTDLSPVAKLDAELEHIAAHVRESLAAAAEGVVEAGRLLAEVKAELKHGEFTGWISRAFDMSESTARRFMRVARAFGETANVDRFDPSALYLLASAPEEARDEAMRRAAAGERISHSTARAIREEHRPAPTVSVSMSAPQPAALRVTVPLAPTEVLDPEVRDDLNDIFGNSPSPSPLPSPQPSPSPSPAMRAMTSSETNEWYTPPALIGLVHAILDGPPDLDPASSPRANLTVKARKFLTAADDGLKYRGRANTVFINPPGGKRDGASNAGLWLDHAIARVKAGDWKTVLFLIFNAASGSKWFRPVWHWPSAWLYRRVPYVRADGTVGESPPPNNGVLVLLERGPERLSVFERVLTPYARVIHPDEQPRVFGVDDDRLLPVARSAEQRALIEAPAAPTTGDR